MKNKKNKKNDKYAKTPYPNTYYTKFKKVHLIAQGPIVLCQATTVDGVAETFSWNKKSDRELVKANTLPDAEIIIDKSVPENRGWNYNA